MRSACTEVAKLEMLKGEPAVVPEMAKMIKKDQKWVRDGPGCGAASCQAGGARLLDLNPGTGGIQPLPKSWRPYR